MVVLLTALSVKFPARRRGLLGRVERLRGDKVEVQLRRANGVTLRHIIYTGYSGEVKLEKADEAVGIRRDRLLCSERLSFPPHSGYRRFRSDAFSRRLCTNFALSALAQCGAAPRVAIYDPDACCAELLPHVLELCGDVTVVTDCSTPYFAAAGRALEEQGAAAVITRRRADLCGRDLIIAPKIIREALPAEHETVTLTTGRPLMPIGGRVLWRYRFQMPADFAAIKPEELSEEYFCSALYTLENRYELGSLVPLAAYGDALACDAKTLAKWLDKRYQMAYNKQVSKL